MAEPTCDCGHSRYDHELGDCTERPGPCHGAFDCECECEWYEGPDQDDLDEQETTDG